MRRQRLLTVVGILAGAGLVLLAASQPWVTQHVSGIVGVRDLQASASQAAPAVGALALAAAAGAIVLLIAGRLVARLAGVLVVLAGGGVVASAVAVLSDPRGAAAAAVPAATGRAGPLPDPAAASAWVWVALAAGAVLVLAGALAAVRGPAWAAQGRRFEPDSGAPAAVAGPQPGRDAGEQDPIAAWDALSRGDDPT